MTWTRTRRKNYRYPYCLSIIDMQSKFSASEAVLDNCVRLVCQAIKDGAYIAVAQYRNYGKTHSKILDCLKGWGPSPADFGFCHSAYDDKSHVITNLMYKNNVHTGKVVFCGVNTDACVASTVEGFAKLHPEKQLVVIADACAASGGKMWHHVGLDKVRRYAEVRKGDVYESTLK